MLTELDRKIVRVISKDLPLVEKPFELLARRLKIEEGQLLRRLRRYKKNALLRKYCAVLNHRKIGFTFNAMVVWNIPIKSIVRAGKIMASFPEVTHCYQRPTTPDWEYNLYSMIHGKTKKKCVDLAERVSKKIGFDDFKILFSSKEYKKTGVKY